MTKEKILIIAVKQPDQHEERFESSLEEIISLSNTAGGKVEEIVTQNRSRIHPATYIGEGKVEEIEAIIADVEIDLVISNDELSRSEEHTSELQSRGHLVCR